MWDRLVVLEPVISLGNSFRFGGAKSIAVFLGRNHDRGNHSFEQMNDGGKLAGAQALQQFHGMLLVAHRSFS
jgi:hypothetical protein